MKFAIIQQELSRPSTDAGAISVVLGRGAIYRLTEPVAFDDYDDEICRVTDYVVISTSTVLGMVETYAFAADETGRWLSGSELPGSMKGCSSHEEVLDAMGYAIKPRCLRHDECKENEEMGLLCAEAEGATP